MLEDRLDKEQRIRLEALKQAVASTGPYCETSILVNRTRLFAALIRDGYDLTEKEEE